MVTDGGRYDTTLGGMARVQSLLVTGHIHLFSWDVLKEAAYIYFRKSPQTAIASSHSKRFTIHRLCGLHNCTR